MRDLKMRGFDTQYNKWAYFTLEHFISGDVTTIAERCKWWCENTGLKDKNGKEIYEGDIITINHPFKGRSWTGEIVYEDYAFNGAGFMFPHFDNPADLFSEGTEYIAVIGNIYENKDLLQ